ncbi:hypothetical protein SK128_027233 [Halocaridina rubra]|uniref:BTB domain-containing protein n=1 Tax=Halocaridina rubra TaxID=373956 RepID=A0AAN8WL78_HALRR
MCFSFSIYLGGRGQLRSKRRPQVCQPYKIIILIMRLSNFIQKCLENSRRGELMVLTGLIQRMGEQRRCWLRWHNYSDSVTSALEYLRYHEDFLDVTIACGGHTFRAHKLVLSACSSYFRKVLKDHPCDHPIIILDDLQWQVIVSILHFMYCGEVIVEEELLPNLLSAADSLDVTGLTYVTAAIVSSQVPKDDNSNDDDYSEYEEEGDDPEDDDEYENEPEKVPEPSAIVQNIITSERDQSESENESSLSEKEEPSPKRPRTISCDAQTSDEYETQTDSQNSTKNMPSSTTPKESTLSFHKVTNGLSPLTLPLNAATPLADHPSNNCSNGTRKNKELQSTIEKTCKNGEKKTKMILNGDSNIKEENLLVKDEGDDDSNSAENGDSDSLSSSLSASAIGRGLILPNGLLENCLPVGMTAAMGPVNYATLLAAGNMLPSAASTNPTVLLSSQGMKRSFM